LTSSTGVGGSKIESEMAVIISKVSAGQDLYLTNLETRLATWFGV